MWRSISVNSIREVKIPSSSLHLCRYCFSPRSKCVDIDCFFKFFRITPFPKVEYTKVKQFLPVRNDYRVSSVNGCRLHMGMLQRHMNATVHNFKKPSIPFLQSNNYVDCTFTSIYEPHSLRRILYRANAITMDKTANTDLDKQSIHLGELQRAYITVAERVPSSTEEDTSIPEEAGTVRKVRVQGDGESPSYKRTPRVKYDPKYRILKQRQVMIEIEAWQQATMEYKQLLKDMCEQRLAPNLPYMKSLFLGWFEPLREAIAKEQNSVKPWASKKLHRYLDKLPADIMAVITMHKLMEMLISAKEHGCVKVVPAACAIGEAIEQEVKIYKLFENATKKTKTKRTENSEPASKEDKLREKVSNLIKSKKILAVKHILKGFDDSKPWSQNEKAKVGSRLLELLIETAFVQPPASGSANDLPDFRPAFVHSTRVILMDKKRINKRYGIIRCDPSIINGLDKSVRHMVMPYMPMLVPPKNWTSYNRGAHFFLPSYIMRIHGAKQQREAILAAPRKQLEPVFEALDTLGNTKWRINKRVLSIVERIWNNGGCLADMVDRKDVALPEKPNSRDEAVVRRWMWKLKSAKKENMERHSLRCDTELKLAVARKMRGEDGFYYPHNLDFRGRAYPMHPYLNHLGSDMCRGILEFAEGRPLGKSGVQWLKIHLANVFGGGIDKLSFDGRVAFTENHLDDIFDSADRPLEGKRWWLHAEDPFQCLAVCLDLASSLRSCSPEMFISHIPIHQDGSCNGLQHYAALGRDKVGAVSVNLVAGEKPADVYTGIAARVVDIMRRDAGKDPSGFPDALHARMLVNQVDRKLVKQTVMTSVYGVTYIGARDQIKRRLKERACISDDAEIYRASCYAAKVTLVALREMFQAARDIMNWLGECAKVIASENEPVRWTTPIGLPVVQPYHKQGLRVVKTSLQILSLKQGTDKVIVKRQRTAFPPNFVHSLDGSHMMMSAAACKKAGLTFAGVHDSYWTHACDVDKMNKILREKFVELYEKPILENLLESFQKTFPSLKFPSLPPRGDLDVREVLNSPYFFN